MAILEISIVPIGTPGTSVSAYVAQCQRVLEAYPHIKSSLNSMGTVLEGSSLELLALAGKLHESVFDSGAQRVYTVMKLDDRRDKESTMDGKIDSVKKRLAEKPNSSGGLS